VMALERTGFEPAVPASLAGVETNPQCL
jgi:hypothetical protein